MYLVQCSQNEVVINADKIPFLSITVRLAIQKRPSGFIPKKINTKISFIAQYKFSRFIAFAIEILLKM